MDITKQECISNIVSCKYISNAGLLIKSDEYSMTTYDKWRCYHDYNKLRQEHGMIISIKISSINEFIQQVFPRINVKFVLVTSDCDTEVPTGVLDSHRFYQFINDERVIHWYSVNCLEHLHDKLTLIPLGINLHSISFQHHPSWLWTDEYLSPKDVEDVMIDIKNNSKPFYERLPKCYSNFHFTPHEKNGTSDRIEAIKKIPKDLVFYEEKPVTLKDTWANQVEYAFVISPRGNGLDCHRTWEALILGCIVIVKKGPLDSLYTDLPVLIVNDWDEVNQELLDSTIEKFKHMDFNYEKLEVNYWLNLMKQSK